MSGFPKDKDPAAKPAGGPLASPRGKEPSDPAMEDILASIRRILNDDAGADAAPGPQKDVLVLDESMMVAKPEPAAAPTAVEKPTTGRAAGGAAQAAALADSAGEPQGESRGLVAPETAAATAAAVGNLIKRLAGERQLPVHRGGPTLEDLVREELRPLLKAWLDANLADLVERVARSEVERIIGRAVP